MLIGSYFYAELPIMKAKYLLVAAALFFIMPSCKKKEVVTDVPVSDTTQTYFSVRQFLQDQLQTYWGQPYSLHRIATVNGKVDSSMVNFSNMEWAPIYKAFLDADIGFIKYLGHYKFSRFETDQTGNVTLSYDATEEKLFTRTLQLQVDPTNDRILNIYIQTRKDSKSQKLLYIPLKVIQIQEDDASWTGSKQNIRLEYRFLQ